MPLARKVGATATYYNPKQLVALAHRNGIYLIGRVVVLPGSEARARRGPTSRSSARTASVWTTSAGLGWVNPYDRRVWDYCRLRRGGRRRAGFDQIMFDYVRFPSDGDVGERGLSGQDERARRASVIADFVAYAKKRLEPLGVRVSTALFGLSATRDLGIGQVPRWISKHVDNISPMAYPVALRRRRARHREPERPARRDGVPHARRLPAPGEGLARAAVPWVQDWNYDPEQVLQQVAAARLQGAKGFLLWNAVGALHEGRAGAARVAARRRRHGPSRARLQPSPSRS